MRKVKRALITGASGFIGSHLARFLYDKGWAIWAVHYRHTLDLKFPVRSIQSDLTRFDEALAVVRQARPDYLFHFAGQAVPRDSWKDPERTMELNVASTLNLLEGMVRFAPRGRVLLASSTQVYGNTFQEKPRPKESDLANPTSPYGGSKLLMELAGLDYFGRTHLPVVIARSSNQVGARQNRHYAFASFCRQVALMEKGAKPPVLEVGNIDVVRDFIGIGDATRAYYLLATKGKPGEIYNVSSGRGILLRKAVDFLRRESGIPFKIKRLSKRFSKNDIPYVVSDIRKLKNLGWRPSPGGLWKELRNLLEECRRGQR